MFANGLVIAALVFPCVESAASWAVRKAPASIAWYPSQTLIDPLLYFHFPI
jgi:hypothetical protein